MATFLSRRAVLRLALPAAVAGRAMRAQEPTEGPITPGPERPKSVPLSGTAETPAAAVVAPSADPTFSSNIRVVNVFATVRDEHGKLVKNLQKQDFTLSEDGKLQNIGYFARESDLPLTIGFLVDTSGSTQQVLPDERSAARQFTEKVLRESKDHAFVLHFDHEVELLQDVTESRPKLERALDELETSQGRWSQSSGSGNPSGGRGGGWPGRPGGPARGGGGQRRGGGGGTLLFDAVMLASKDVMQHQPGRKALIILSDGDDRGSKTTMTAAVEAAQRADTLIYSVLFKGEEPRNFRRRGGYGGSADPEEVDTGRNSMKWMAHSTGGSFFIVTEDRPIDRVFAQIEEELRNQYSLGYTSDGSSTSKEFRRISLDTRLPGLTVHARSGYFPG